MTSLHVNNISEISHLIFWFHSNFQTRLLGLFHGNMSQHQEVCTVTAALNCRTQKQLEVTSKFHLLHIASHWLLFVVIKAVCLTLL